MIGGGTVYAIDRETMEVTALFGRRGRQSGQFLSAHSGTLDSHGNLYVTETLDGSRTLPAVNSSVLVAWRAGRVAARTARR